MIRLYLNLSNEVYNTMNQHYQKHIRFLSLILLILSDIFVKEIKKVFNDFVGFIINQNFYVITFTMYSTNFFRIFRRKKVYVHC